ncbi:MAG: primosomal protein N' [Flavobacteriales bacterium]|nr:MAG: primosomal protein N' [Flavobacteriales bacterium]
MENIQLGMRVLVPFGGKKIYTGIVSEIHQREPENFVAKEIINLLDKIPILPLEQLKFWQWISDYYWCNIGEIYRFAFPSSLKLESETYLQLKPNVEIDFEPLDANEIYLMQALEVKQLVNLSEIEAFIPKKYIVKTIQSLIGLGYIEVHEKIAEKYKAKEVTYLKINEEEVDLNRLPEYLLQLKRAKKQQALFLHLVELQTEKPDQPIKKSSIFENGAFSYAQLKSLVQKKWVTEYLLEQDRLPTYDGEIEEVESLTEAQQNAISEINQAFENQKNVLLQGVTSSGKTHIYLQKIEDTIAEGKCALLLLPEIALTKQITLRLEKKYGDKLGFYHQKLTDFEKVEVWRKIKRHQIKILIGTRNALFLPYENLGLIIVDEEHDSLYRPKEVSPYFNAKDAVHILAKHYQSKVIFGSATPSLETYFLAQQGKLALVELNERFGKVSLPTYELINFKKELEEKKVSGQFSEILLNKLKQNLANKKQAMILHNRRGYANVIECESCGHVNYCGNCDVVMTYHKSAHEMKCHYCGQRASKPKTCLKCHSENLNEKGVGVEQIHEELKHLLPEAEVDRMDIDSMRKKFAYEKLYEKIDNKETDIIVGTQMISKGLDFDDIEIIGIPRADQLLYVQDYRAEERAYQLITQLSGRAGRVSGKGKVYIQTYNPEHIVFQLIKKNEIHRVYQYLLDERKKFHYPPFTKMILIELKHRKEDKVNRASQFLGSVLRKYLPEACIFGPEKSPIARINLMYQYQVLLKLPKGKKYQLYKNLILQSLAELDEISGYKTLRKRIIVDF